MHQSLIALPVVVLALAAPAYGQQGRILRREAEPQKQLVPAQVTPEMWIYSQEMRRYDDPQQMIRRRAELKASQRDARLAAMKWFGFSNARPQANPVPFMSVYSPTWVGNSFDRYDWAGGSGPPTTVLLQNFEVNR